MSCEVEPAQKYSITNMNKSVEDLLISSHDVINSINSSSLGSQGSATSLTNGPPMDGTQSSSLGGGGDRSSPISSPNLSPRLSPRSQNKREYVRLNSDSTGRDSSNTNKSDDQYSQDVVLRSAESGETAKSLHEVKKEARSSERSKKKTSWYSVLYPTYKSRSEDFKRIFKDVPDDERLVVGLTSDDEDYVPSLPPADDEKLSTRLSVDSFSEVEVISGESPAPSPAMEPVIEPEPQPQPMLKADPVPDPTDLSDTTESEAEKHGLVKIGLRNPAICTASHEGREVCKATLPIHIDQLFTLLFTKSKFFLDFHTARKTTDLLQSTWTQDNQTGQKMRTITLTVALTQSIGPRTCQVTETQIMLPCSRPGHLYSIDVESINAGIPYADSFSVMCHYCLTSISDEETNLIVYSQIKYKKSVWSFIKGVIEKNCWAGLDEYFSSLIKALTEECDEGSGGSGGLKRKARRRRRATGVGPTLHTHSPDHVSPSHQVFPPELPHIHNNIVPGTRTDSNIILSSMLLIAVLCLMVINGLLYYKLWGLEEAAAYTIMDLHSLKDTPKTEEDWINLLQQQESLHNVEMRKWQRVLHTAAQLLRKTEESLTELQMSIHPSATEKMFSVLKPNLKPLQSHGDRRSNSEL